MMMLYMFSGARDSLMRLTRKATYCSHPNDVNKTATAAMQEGRLGRSVRTMNLMAPAVKTRAVAARPETRGAGK